MLNNKYRLWSLRFGELDLYNTIDEAKDVVVDEVENWVRMSDSWCGYINNTIHYMIYADR